MNDRSKDNLVTCYNFTFAVNVIDLFTDTAATLNFKIQFKEYYRMPRGHEHTSFVFLTAFRDIFS